jgi:hypothetical protein
MGRETSFANEPMVKSCGGQGSMAAQNWCLSFEDAKVTRGRFSECCTFGLAKTTH